jgi:two-component system CheB/CheR fusion protein
MQQERANPVTGAGSSTPVSPVDEGVPIVGVGASAGGLDAFSRLLRRIPCDTGYAFVLVQHLDATHPSSLSEILGRATAMPVGEAEDGTPVAANRIYVIPPNTELTTSRRVLRLGPRASSAHMPIDRFLQSLARDCGSRAVGVILSGNGSDGSAGLVAIKEAGGVTFAQEPSSAEFPSMPTMAVAAGGVDLVLAPDAIAAELARLARHPNFVPSEEPAPPAVDVSQQIRAICGVMHQTTGIDSRCATWTASRRTRSCWPATRTSATRSNATS